MAETAWCQTCRRYQEVMDTYETDDGDAHGTRHVDRRTRLAQPLACGHDAGDGGSAPRPARPVDDQDLTAQVAAAQERSW